MVAHADAEACGNPPQENCKRKCLPTEKKQGGDSTEMKDDHKEDGDPCDGLRKSAVLL